MYNGTHEFDVQKVSDSKRSNDFICLMFIVFAIGSQFAEVEDTPGHGQSSPRSTFVAGATSLDFSRLVIPKPAQSPGWHFYQISRRLLSDVIVSSSMTSVQVCVLQGIFLPSTKSRDAGYNLLGLALRMAVNMGMHRSFGADGLHPHVRELRNRLWWSVYVAERIFSVEMGRPLAISDVEVDAPLPTDMPEWRDFSGKSPTNMDGLVAMIKLCKLLGRIVETVYCSPAFGKDTIVSPQVFRQLQVETEQSRSSLPDSLRLRPDSVTSRSVAHISLAYEQATILLTRSSLNFAAVASNLRTLDAESMLLMRQRARTCVNSAVATIRIMFNLRSRSLLCRFSFHDSLYCTAALYVLLLGARLDWLPANITKDPIQQGIMVLLDLAKGSELAASALRHIVRGLPKSKRDSAVFNNLAQGENVTRLEEGRKAWKTWLERTSHGMPGPATVSDRDSETAVC